jgi:hypothetical protein
LVLTEIYRTRRALSLFQSDGMPDGTDIAITASGSRNYRETMYSIDEVPDKIVFGI